MIFPCPVPMSPLGLGALLLVVTCQIFGAASAQGAVRLRSGDEYVALGSSFAAGPGITKPAVDGLRGCEQSQDNYARQLAARRSLKLIDRSCGGATTEHVLRQGFRGHPPQVESVTRRTKLVSVTIGGNDVGYMANLFGWSCSNLPPAQPERPCPAAPGVEDAKFAALAANMRALVATIRQQAPKARIVFVDYVTVLPPPSEGCAVTPLKSDQIAVGRALAKRLAALTAAVARDTGADLIAASTLSQDHHACAARPWANGLPANYRYGAPGPAPYHPRIEAMSAIAGALQEILSR
jgi:lysophospholipase L1-like esterase